MNKHIELVKKWLDDPNSVTKKELIENADADAAAYAAYAAARTAARTADAEYYVKEYEEYEELTRGEI